MRPTPLLHLFWVQRAALTSEDGIHARPFWAASLRWNRRMKRRSFP